VAQVYGGVQQMLIKGLPNKLKREDRLKWNGLITPIKKNDEIDINQNKKEGHRPVIRIILYFVLNCHFSI